MNKRKWKYFIDSLLFICLVGLAGIGYLQGLYLEEGPVEDVSKKYFLGLHSHQWGHIHFYISIAFTALIIIHLILNWSWIKSSTQKIFKKYWGGALVGIFIISLLVPLIIWTFSPKYSEKYAEYGTGSGRGRQISLPEKQVTEQPGLTEQKTEPVKQPVKREESIHEEEQRLARGRMDEQETGILITGQMTLLELEEKTGIPKSTLLKELGIPDSIPYSETLGRLRRRYNFTMQELRDKIEAQIKKKVRF